MRCRLLNGEVLLDSAIPTSLSYSNHLHLPAPLCFALRPPARSRSCSFLPGLPREDLNNRECAGPRAGSSLGMARGRVSLPSSLSLLFSAAFFLSRGSSSSSAAYLRLYGPPAHNTHTHTGERENLESRRECVHSTALGAPGKYAYCGIPKGFPWQRWGCGISLNSREVV